MVDIQKNYNLLLKYDKGLADLYENFTKSNNIEKVSQAFNLSKGHANNQLALANDIIHCDPKHELVLKINEDAAAVWLEKVLWKNNYEGISDILGFSKSKCKALYHEAKHILNHQEELWTAGLSNRARFALLKKYKGLSQLQTDLSNPDFELQSLDGVGDAVEEEIFRWLKKKDPI